MKEIKEGHNKKGGVGTPPTCPKPKIIPKPRFPKKKMKVLFLDHDGVICLMNQWGGRYNKQEKYGAVRSLWGISTEVPTSEMPVCDRFDDFDQDAIDILNRIIMETDCEVVVSSDWKNYANVEEMGDYYESQGIIKKPIGFTPFRRELPKELKYYHRDTEQEEVRSYEILQWLSNNPTVKQWVAVDDLDMGKIQLDYDDSEYERDWGLYNFVRTQTYGDGIKEEGIYEKIVEYLK